MVFIAAADSCSGRHQNENWHHPAKHVMWAGSVPPARTVYDDARPHLPRNPGIRFTQKMPLALKAARNYANVERRSWAMAALGPPGASYASQQDQLKSLVASFLASSSPSDAHDSAATAVAATGSPLRSEEGSPDQRRALPTTEEQGAVPSPSSSSRARTVQPRQASAHTGRPALAYPRSPVQLHARTKTAVGNTGGDTGGDRSRAGALRIVLSRGSEDDDEDEVAPAEHEAGKSAAAGLDLHSPSGGEVPSAHLEVLGRVPLLASLSRAQLARLHTQAECRSVPRYGVVLRRGAPCPGPLVLICGSVQCSLGDGPPESPRPALHRAGAVLGLDAWRRGTAVAAEHVAAEACTVLRIPGRALLGLPLQLGASSPSRAPQSASSAPPPPPLPSSPLPLRSTAHAGGAGSGHALSAPAPTASPRSQSARKVPQPQTEDPSAQCPPAPFDPFVHVEVPPPPPPPLFGPGIERLHAPQLPPLLVHSTRTRRQAPAFGSSASVGNGGRHTPFGSSLQTRSGAQTSRPATSTAMWRPEGPREFSLEDGGSGDWLAEAASRPIWDKKRKDALLASQRVLRPSGQAHHQSYFASNTARPSMPSTPQGHDLLDAIAAASLARTQQATPPTATGRACQMATHGPHELGERSLVLPRRKGRGKGLEVEARELSWIAVDVNQRSTVRGPHIEN